MIPVHLDIELRKIGVVPPKKVVPPPPQPTRAPMTGTWYASPDDIEF